MDYQKAYEFVKDQFARSKEHRAAYGFREKWSHTERVVKWARRLADKTGARKDVLIMAAIFHDVGYTITPTSEGHALSSAKICRKYLVGQGYPHDYIDDVCELVLGHGKKELLCRDNPNLEQVLLIEADCLDENGAMSIIRDAICEGQKAETGYDEVYERILRFPLNEGMFDCVTDEAREIWEEKKRVFWEFVHSFGMDVGKEEGDGPLSQ